MESELFLKNLIGDSKIESMRSKMSNYGGRLVDGVNPFEIMTWLKRNFADFGNRVLLASKEVDKLEVSEYTVIGGWCALRTADLFTLRKGLLTDLQTGEFKPYQSIKEVANWLKNYISIDQIIEAIGVYNGSNYFAISEERLWANRIKKILGQRLRRRLNSSEEGMIDQAINLSEQLRYFITQKYLAYVSGNSINLTRVSDNEVYDELVDVRNEMLDLAGMSLKKLIETYPEEKDITPEYSIVWGMYTGPYLAMLQKKGYINTPKGLIVEPWGHAISETRAKAYVDDKIFTRYPYLKEGANENLGFVAYADVLDPSGERMTLVKTIGLVPNVCNYVDFIRQLIQDPKCGEINLAGNPAFIWGVNLLPFGKTKEALLQMIDLRQSYLQEKDRINREQSSAETRQRAILELKRNFKSLMREQSYIISEELKIMFVNVFNSP